MTSHRLALSFDANDPARLARFWAAVLDREPADDPHGGIGSVALPPADGADDTGLRVRFLPTREQKTVQSRMHFDLTSTSLDDQQRTVEKVLDLGGRHTDVGQGPDADHVVLADPEGNEFCVIEPGNNFLAGCGFVGALSCDGTQAVGYFWSKALDWPLVWDQDQETAIQSPRGGAKVTWGGPPLMPRGPGGDRLRYDLLLSAGDDLRAEVDRLISLGATRTDGDTHEDGAGRDAAGGAALADPDGNVFRVLPAVRACSERPL